MNKLPIGQTLTNIRQWTGHFLGLGAMYPDDRLQAARSSVRLMVPSYGFLATFLPGGPLYQFIDFIFGRWWEVGASFAYCGSTKPCTKW